MDTRAVHQAVSHWLSRLGYASARATTRRDSLRTWGSDAEWFVVLRGDLKNSFDYIRKFDDAIDAVITRDRAATNLPVKLGVAVAFSSTLRGDVLSYRKALKKYTNSILFTDLDIHMFFVHDDLSIKLLEPDEVNEFIRELNRYIITARP